MPQAERTIGVDVEHQSGPSGNRSIGTSSPQTGRLVSPDSRQIIYVCVCKLTAQIKVLKNFGQLHMFV